ncbi:MAG TPA: hypothetical protein PKV73_00985 [Agriterribacter sp.]|nr:hypothetical protein [Agriterribacter sp.]
MLIYQILYAAFCIWFAYQNKKWIAKDKKILHGWNGLIHIAAALVAWWLFNWCMFIIILCEARIVFDVSLNKFRGLEFDYVPIKPKSIVDRMERKIFGEDGVSPKIVYAFFALGFNVIYFVL